jgi:formiminoglutamase
MSGGSSNVAGWFTRLEPGKPPVDVPYRADDPRLAQVVEFWTGNSDAVRPGRPVIIGFPQDEGVRHNGGRAGAADAPFEIRRWLYRLTPDDCQKDLTLTTIPPLDAGNVIIKGDLDATQEALAEVVGGVLANGAIPVVLGGGHETALGHYLGYVAARRKVGVINLDAHLDVRPLLAGKGHSGSPFRQALENTTAPLSKGKYHCLGLQPHAVARDHVSFVREKDCKLHWAGEVDGNLENLLQSAHDQLARDNSSVFVSLDADVVRMAEVPGVSAPNPSGLSARELIAGARLAGSLRHVSSFELVEINPRLDRDGQSARWAAVVIWNFMMGLAGRIADLES